MRFSDDTQFVCLGDSITDSGKYFEAPPLGNGYVKLLQDRLQQQGHKIMVKNCGVNGFTVKRLLLAVTSGSLPVCSGVSPKYFTLLIGINDIGYIMSGSRSESEIRQMMETFFDHLHKLLKILLEISPNILVMEPFVFPCPAVYKLWIPRVKTMSHGIQALTEAYSLPYLPLHDYLNNAALTKGYNALTTDGIHLTGRGHELLAQKLWDCILYQ